jgi:hypothetical protein
MKKLFFTAIALVAFSGISMASTKEGENLLPQNHIVSTINLNVENAFKLYNSNEFKEYYSTIDSKDFQNKDDSLTCWAFGKWLRAKLNAISDDTALIDQCVDAAVALCNIFT